MEDTVGEGASFTVEILLRGVSKDVLFPFDSTTVDFVESKMRSTYNIAHGTLSSRSHQVAIVNRLVAGGKYYFLEFSHPPAQETAGSTSTGCDAPAAKKARVRMDCSDETIRRLCVPFDERVLVDIGLLKEALTPRLLVKIPLGPYDSGLSVAEVFEESYDDREACYLVHRFRAFEARCGELMLGVSEKTVLVCITEVTGMMWRHMAMVMQLNPVLSYRYHIKEVGNATDERDDRPNEMDFLNTFMACKSEYATEHLHEAIHELRHNLRGYNHIDYGTKIVFLPVIAAAGTYVEFAVIDVRNQDYHFVARCDVRDTVGRVHCFVMAINVYRLIATMAPFIPSNPRPWFI